MNTWVQLGAAGDIMSILPILWKDAQAGKRWALKVSQDYSGILEGVSYVDPIIYPGPRWEVRNACHEASLNGTVVCGQVNGPSEDIGDFVYKLAKQDGARTTSFVKEMWKVAGRLKEWDDQPPLVFDKRNPEREAALLEACGWRKAGKNRRVILVSLWGKSSPFQWAELALELIKGRFGESHRILELPHAERIYDLLALYEKADALVAVDSAPLHLANALPSLPVVALTQDQPSLWHGSPWRPNHVAYCRYGDFPTRAVELLDTLQEAITPRIGTPTGPKVVHVWNAYDSKPTVKSPWIALPIRPGMCGRDSQSVEKDPKRVPYLKDCIRMGLQKKGDYVVVTHPQAQIVDPKEVTNHQAGFAYRILRDGQDEGFQPTVDLFFATKEWWRSHLDEIPDYFLGRDYWWTHGLRGLFTKHSAVDITGAVTKSKSEKPEGASSPPYPPRIKLNKYLSETYITKSGVYSRYPKLVDQVEVVANFTGQLRNAYNPAIVEHKGQILMAVRWHPYPTPSTSLMLIELNQDYTVKSSQPIDFLKPTVSSEDPKWFVHNGDLHMSWVDATWPSPNKPQSVVRYWSYKWETFQDEVRPELPGNDGTTCQKNYVFWSWFGRLFCQHNCQPYTVYELESNGLVKVSLEGTPMQSESPKWAYGTIRGGTPPVQYEGKWLRFCHGHLDNEWAPWSRRYYMLALLIEPKPPFNVLRVSRKPILYGSEICDLKVSQRPKHFKGNVVFPGGVIERSDHWVCSIGCNDSSSLLVKITPKDLNL